jgi:hypothetical protein
MTPSPRLFPLLVLLLAALVAYVLLARFLPLLHVLNGAL